MNLEATALQGALHLRRPLNADSAIQGHAGFKKQQYFTIFPTVDE
jgi:hypothetical protein